MSDILSEWKYTDLVAEARRGTLAAPGSFAALVDLVAEDACNVRASGLPGFDPGLTDCFQPIFILDLPKTGDALFNGPWGYRAQYWASPQQGLKANALLLEALTPKLLSAVDVKIHADLTRINVCAALNAVSSKIWIPESHLIYSTEDLAVARWAAAARSGVQLARWGLSAPTISTFEIKGALLDTHGNEVVPARKIRRHYDIYHYGFS